MINSIVIIIMISAIILWFLDIWAAEMAILKSTLLQYAQSATNFIIIYGAHLLESSDDPSLHW